MTSMKKVVVLQYNAGNIRSVVNALRRLGVEPLVSDDADVLCSADRIIVPGQGEAANTMAYLRKRQLDRLILSLEQPVLGICIGQQLFCESSEEGDTSCLGIFKGVRVRKFVAMPGERLKVPHIGWNTLSRLQGPLFSGLSDESYVYYVHSYYAPVCEYTQAETTYGGVTYSAAMRKDNFFATQFHPEKSGDVGELILKNFINGEWI